MQNVIAFPEVAKTAPVRRSMTGAKTLFMHIKRTTLILHVAAAQTSAIANGRVGKQI